MVDDNGSSTIHGPLNAYKPVMTLARTMLASQTQPQSLTIHWLYETYTPVLQVIDHLATTIANLSANITATFPRKPSILNSPMQKEN